jgi:RNA polymerase sigma factor for flagellar operon FliA
MKCDVNKEMITKAYYSNPTEENRAKMIEAFAPLVKYIAGRIQMSVGDYYEYDDLCSFGIFGLIDSITRYSLDMGTKFETYASLRIRGAILDEVRKHSVMPRQLLEKKKKVDQAIQELSSEGQNIDDSNLIAKKLGMDLDDYYKLTHQFEVYQMIPVGLIGTDDDEIQQSLMVSNVGLPEEETVAKVSKKELSSKLQNALDKLTEKERQVILLYYYEEMTLKEVATVMGISEGRTSQLHTKALGKLKDNISPYRYLLSFS